MSRMHRRLRLTFEGSKERDNHMAFMMNLTKKALVESGELVSTEGFACRIRPGSCVLVKTARR